MNSLFVRLSRLNKDIDAIKSFIRLGEWARTHNLSLLDDPRTGEERNLYSRQFDYSATISRLYFTYESFIYFCIREWVVFALDNASILTDFSAEKFFDDYANGCGQLLQRTDEQRFSNLTKKSITESLYGVQKKDKSVTLIIEALTVDLPNLRANTLQSLSQRAQLIDLNKWCASCRELGDACSYFIGNSLIENALTDFVERRNAISHGRFEDDEIYATNILLRLCEFIEMLCRTFAEFVSYNIIMRGRQAVVLGSIVQKYNANSSYLVKANAEMFDIGREVFLCRKSVGRCYPSKITDLRLEDAPMLGITTNAGDLVGMQLSTPATKGTEIVRILEVA